MEVITLRVWLKWAAMPFNGFLDPYKIEPVL